MNVQDYSDLVERCEIAGLPVQLLEEDGSTLLAVSFKKGRKDLESKISLHNEVVDALRESSFEDYRPIDGYEGIWSAKHGIVEARLRPLEYWGFSVSRMQSYSESIHGEVLLTEDGKSIRLQSLTLPNGVEVFLQSASHELFIIRYGDGLDESTFQFGCRRTLVLRFEGLAISSHKEALDLLNNIGQSVLFEVDIADELGLHFTPDSEYRPDIQRRAREEYPAIQLRSPRNAYDSVPLSLYWYARSPLGSPIYRYLGFYQILEHYFPVYTMREAQERLRNILKDPLFNPDDEKALYRVLATARSNSGDWKGVDERSQLYSALSACVDPLELRTFIEAETQLSSYFSSKASSALSSHRISLESKNDAFLREVAHRIYDIRCRIVHSKADETELKSLVPGSPELRNIGADLGLIKFVAVRVLISNSKDLSRSISGA